MQVTSRFSYLAVFALSLAFAGSAAAQITAQPFKISIKGTVQAVGSMDYKVGKISLGNDDVFFSCIGLPKTSSRDLYAYFDCDNLNNNTIAAVDLDPITIFDTIGQFTFDFTHGVSTTADDLAVLKKVTVPFTLFIDCTGITVSASGIADFTFKEYAGDTCPDTFKAKVTGVGDRGDPFIVDDGSSVSAKKPNPDVPIPK